MVKNNEIKPMICPICGEYYFTDSFNKESDDFDQCRHCGWIYDYEQYKNPNLKNGNNILSLNEYKLVYQEKIRANQNYDYSEENSLPFKPHLCPVCGEFKFPDSISSLICPICGWEDTGFEDDPDLKPSPYMMSLNEHKEWFRSQRTSNPKFRHDQNYKIK